MIEIHKIRHLRPPPPHIDLEPIRGLGLDSVISHFFLQNKLRSHWSLAIEYLLQRSQSFPSVVKGTVARDFQLQVFFQKIAEIFAAQGARVVDTRWQMENIFNQIVLIILF